MLTPQETAEIEHELSQYERKRAACIDALKIVQRHRGWVSDEALHDIAELLEMPVDELDAVATFYNLIYRRPVGRHVVHLCDSVSCWLAGSDALAERIRERFGVRVGETDSEGRFTVLPIPCLGCCDRAPAMLVDGNLHVDLDPERLDETLERYG
ncbi:MAG: NADH-quinone oxidoreductase subunit NuoE [Gammaproteobacteria bacterium]|nr:NADH-quinone oxidoreductase subunit NuoE [Gammaproteobacteria bacterium]